VIVANNREEEIIDMGKMKTRKAVKKRFKKTGTGKFKKTKAFAQHIMTKKSSKRKRNFRKGEVAAKADEKRIARALPYE
jgi:large subunit ribosomal protein L35